MWSTVLSNEKGPLQLHLTADGLPSPSMKPHIYWYLEPHTRIHTSGDPKIPGIVKKNLFEVFVQV